jgi:DNA-binding CsgD family transcriptional regulator
VKISHAPPAILHDAAPTPATIRLSGREVEVLRVVSAGHTNKEAARKLAISPRTVGAHLENVFRKLGCTTRTQAALKASALRLI